MIKAVFYFKDKSVTIHYENAETVRTTFKNGYYTAKILGGEGKLLIECINFTEIHEPFPNQASSEVLQGTIRFLETSNKESLSSMGFIYKLNCLMYGKPGVGKTALLNYIAYRLIENYNAIVFRVDGPSNIETVWSLGESIRKIQNNPIVFLMDEFDQYSNKNVEPYMKMLIDGPRSINNSIILAATNYIDRIPNTFLKRPSRFRIISEITGIEDEQIIKNLITKLHDKCVRKFLTEEDINSMSKNLKPATIDSIKTAVVDKAMGISIKIPYTSNVGFNRRDKEYDLTSCDPEKFNELLKDLERNEDMEDWINSQVIKGEALISTISNVTDPTEPSYKEGLTYKESPPIYNHNSDHPDHDDYF